MLYNINKVDTSMSINQSQEQNMLYIVDNANDKNCRIIANAYLQNKIHLLEATNRLSHYGSNGQYIAAELCLVKAATSIPTQASSWLILAQKKLENAFDTNNHNDNLKLKTYERLLQLNILKTILIDHDLPSEKIVYDEYSKLVSISSYYLDKLVNQSPYNDREKQSLVGKLGEIAVLALAQRWALREIGTKDWLPIQSFFHEDHGGNCLYVTNQPAWDITIYESKLDPLNPVQQTHKIQIKNSHPQIQERSNHNNIPTIYINDDLASYPNEPSVFRNILLSCNYELMYPTKAQRLSRELNDRTEKLLNILD